MPKPSSAQIRAKAKLANQVIMHHFGKSVKKIEFKPAGKTNFVFDVQTKDGNYILRIATAAARFNGFLKEQWATQKAKEKGIPVPEILEVGNDVIPFPYMLQKRLEGKEATDHPDRLDILFSLGTYAKLIHSIPTEGFGSVFDWSRNELSKQKTWVGYLENELCVEDRLNFLQSQNILTKRKTTKLVTLFNKIKRWKLPPCLNHCDLRLKNVIVNEAGKILAIIDWEECTSNIAPYWDFSIALHDLSIDGKEKFLEGYGLNIAEFDQMSYALTAFNLVNYVPALQGMLERKDKNILALYKLRLNGALDLFSL